MGKDRSPTCAKLWKTLYNDETEYMGIYNESYNHKKLISWADLIVVMEPHQRKWISEKFPEEYLKKKILCMDIPDNYHFMHPELIEVLKMKLARIKTHIWAQNLPKMSEHGQPEHLTLRPSSPDQTTRYCSPLKTISDGQL